MLILLYIFVILFLKIESFNYDKWRLVEIRPFQNRFFSIRKIFEIFENEKNLKIIEINKDELTVGVGPELPEPKFLELLTELNLSSRTLHNDISWLISDAHSKNKRSVGEEDIFDRYMTYDKMEEYFSILESMYPKTVTRKIVGRSYEGRNISLFIVSSSEKVAQFCNPNNGAENHGKLGDNNIVTRYQRWISRNYRFGRYRQKDDNDIRRYERTKKRGRNVGNSRDNRSVRNSRKSLRKSQNGTDSRTFGTSNHNFGTNNRNFGASNSIFGTNNHNFGASSHNFGTNNHNFGASNRNFGTKNHNFSTNNHHFIYLQQNIIKNLNSIGNKTKDELRLSTPKPIIFIDAGVHSREWVCPAVALYLIQKLARTPSMTSHIDWHIMPLVNPDGYKYSWEGDRFWRKTRSKSVNTDCYGADMNRNFDHHWGEVDASKNPCSEHYGGAGPKSEVETRVMADLLVKEKHRLKAYVSLHNWGQQILYPYSYSEHKLPLALEEMDRVGKAMVEAVKSSGKAQYNTGRGASLLYPASGTSSDWVHDVLGVTYSYLIELRDKIGLLGFLLPDSLIKPTGEDVFVAMKVLSSELLKNQNMTCPDK